MESKAVNGKTKLGSPIGLLAVFAIAFGLYFIMGALTPGSSVWMDYAWVVDGIHLPFQKLVWFFMNFTEANFIGGFLSSIMLLLGAALAWGLALRGSRLAGFEICYGSARIWPWVFASQVLALVLSMFVFNYMSLLSLDGVSWVPTFVAIVNVPPALVLIYGPGIKTLLTTSFLGGLLCTPVAFWLNNAVFVGWNMPGVVGNVTAMALVGVLAASICRVLPWMKKTTVKPVEEKAAREENTSGATWFIRRTFADFTEPLFYGNEIVGIFFFVGVFIEWLLSPGLIAGGNMLVPAVLASSLISGATGIFLYAHKWQEKGWYATYVPVVSAAPACVYLFGGSIPIVLFAGIVGGILGAPLAEYIGNKLPDYVPGTVANVSSMALTTAFIAASIGYIPWLN